MYGGKRHVPDTVGLLEDINIAGEADRSLTMLAAIEHLGAKVCRRNCKRLADRGPSARAARAPATSDASSDTALTRNTSIRAGPEDLVAYRREAKTRESLTIRQSPG